MTLGDLIKEKDYDYIEMRSVLPPMSRVKDVFMGACTSKNGELICNLAGKFSKEIEVLNYKKWSDAEILNGLTVVYQDSFSKQE